MAKALELVKKVARIGSSLVLERRGPGGERDGSGRSLATRATVQMLRMTTLVARKMRDLPIPAPHATERLALGAAAAQLRAMTEGALVPEGVSDPALRDSPEAALSELVAETLALVDKILATDPEMTGRAATEPKLPEAASDVERSTKVRF